MDVMGTLKTIGGVLKEANRLDLYAQVLELQSQMLDVLNDKRTMNDQLDAARRKIAELEDQLAVKGALEVGRNSYWLRRGDETFDGPFCTGCWDGKHKLSRLNTSGPGYGWMCPVCKHVTTEPTRPSVRL